MYLIRIAVVRGLTSGVESKPAFVWTQSGVELHSVTSVDLHLFRWVRVTQLSY